MSESRDPAEVGTVPATDAAPSHVLALDTATPQVSVALLSDLGGAPGVVAERRSEQLMKHGEQLAPLIADVLAEAGVDRRELTAIVAGAGPGPFTGLRVGLVTARTLGLTLSIPVYASCSLDVLALEAVATGAVADPFVVVTDARRKEVYLAWYDAEGNRLDGPVVAHPGDVAARVPAVGEGASLYPEAFVNRVGPHRPSAAWLARGLAAERLELTDPEPLYLRRPDAVEQRARKSTLTGTGGRPERGR